MLAAIRTAVIFVTAPIAVATTTPSLASEINQSPVNDTTARVAIAPDEIAPVPLVSLSELIDARAEREAPNADEECIAAAVYFEARGEPIEGQLAVADVVLNRAASDQYPASVCAVVTQAAQFSFVRRGRIPAIPKATEAWRKAVAIAQVAMERIAQQIGSDVLWYHANHVHPAWGRRLTRVTQIGAHVFYSANS